MSDAIAGGANLIILSDRYANEEHAPIPSLLITGAVHHHLIREKTHTRVGLVIETGEAREVHHIALLLGYGAAAVNPYLVFDALRAYSSYAASTDQRILLDATLDGRAMGSRLAATGGRPMAARRLELRPEEPPYDRRDKRDHDDGLHEVGGHEVR